MGRVRFFTGKYMVNHTAKGSAEGSQGQCYPRLAVLAKGRYDEPALVGEEFS